MAETEPAQNKSTQKSSQSNVSLDGPPLDFSFKQIKELKELVFMESRSGKRKPIKKEEEAKEEDKKLDDDENGKSGEQENQEGEKEEKEGEEKQEEQDGEQKNKDKKDEKKKEDKKQPEIVRVYPTNISASSVINTHHIPVNQGGGKNTGGKTYEDVNTHQQKKVFKIQLICSSFILSYNQIRTLDQFPYFLDQIMFNPQNLQWIDLSHNYLDVLKYDFKEYPQLKSLYLHCNYLYNLGELKQLSHLVDLRSITIHGNPVETIPNFRLYIIQMIPQLKRIDSVLISKKEKDNANVWSNQFRNFKPPQVKDPVKVPQNETLDQKEGNKS